MKVWFQNRRMKWRHTKESEKVTETLQDSVANKSNLNKYTTNINKNEEIKSSEDEDVDIE